MKKAQKVKGKRDARGRKQLQFPVIGTIDPDSDESVERQVYRLIREALMAGLLMPGSAMTSRSIAASLGVSTAPVRDALKRLEADGVIQGRNKSAFFINELSRETYLDVLDLRRRIEGHAVARAAINIKNADVVALRELNKRYQNATDDVERVKLNYQFHSDIYKLARSAVLLDVIANLWMRTGPPMHLYLKRYDDKDVLRNHQEIVSALSERDPVRAEAALIRDLDEAVKVIAPRLKSEVL